ncbi:MAG: rod shape-determining protein MreC [Gemmatimonadota bacterium]
MLDFDGTRKARRKDTAIAVGLALGALILFVLPAHYQRPIQHAIRDTALRPFLTAQATIANRRATSVDVNDLRAQRDSLAALVAAEATLGEENARLRALLGLRARTGTSFVPAEVLKLGVSGAESTFMLNVGRADGVEVDSPVLAPEGLVGVIVDVQAKTAHARDWTHPDFRASAMTADGQAYGIVEPRRGRYREEDLLALTGAPFHSDLQPGTPIVTSGRGGVYPRGIPLGQVLGIEEADTGWRKSYLIRAAVRPEAVIHVLVGTRARQSDVSRFWNTAVPPDTATTDSLAASTTGSF